MIDYDRFAAKNAASAKNWYTNDPKPKKEKQKTPQETIGICDRCHEEKLVRAYRTRQTERMDGAATYGMVVKHYCDDCSPRNRKDENAPPAPSKNDVRNMLRKAKKLL